MNSLLYLPRGFPTVIHRMRYAPILLTNHPILSRHTLTMASDWLWSLLFPICLFLSKTTRINKCLFIPLILLPALDFPFFLPHHNRNFKLKQKPQATLGLPLFHHWSSSSFSSSSCTSSSTSRSSSSPHSTSNGTSTSKRLHASPRHLRPRSGALLFASLYLRLPLF